MKTFIIAALTADGFIGQDADHLSTKWTSHADKVFFTEKTKEAGTILCGRTTYETFKRALPGRRTLVYTNHPETITAEGVEPVQGTPQEVYERLKGEGVETLAICGGAQVYSQFLAAGLVDEIFVTVHASLFGTGVTMLNQPIARSLKLLRAEQIGDDTIMLHYSVA
jgi:dihydrofolate reductase